MGNKTRSKGSTLFDRRNSKEIKKKWLLQSKSIIVFEINMNKTLSFRKVHWRIELVDKGL